jgi:hypothetical protein
MLLIPMDVSAFTIVCKQRSYAPQVGAPTEFNNVGYAFFGDLKNNLAPRSIEWPVTVFHQVAASVWVPQREVLDQLLAAGPDLKLLSSFRNEDAGMDVIWVCQVLLLPFRNV